MNREEKKRIIETLRDRKQAVDAVFASIRSIIGAGAIASPQISHRAAVALLRVVGPAEMAVESMRW